MTPHSPSQHPPYQLATRTRVKWDNIAIVLFGVVIASFAVIGIMASGDSAPVKPKASPATPASSSDAEELAPADGTLTMEDSEGLVDEARALMTEARWTEAADRLATIPAEHRAIVGADELQAQLDTIRTTHDRLRAELDAAVEARQWKSAKSLLAQLAQIAALDEPLLEIEALVDNSLQPAAVKPAAKVAAKDEPATAATGGGANDASTPGTATSRPAAQTSTAKPRPKPAAPRPAATTGGGARPAVSNPPPASGSSTATAGAFGDVALTAAQQQELEAALAAALGGNGDL